MSANTLDGLFGITRVLLDGTPAVFHQTIDLIGGWTSAEGVDDNGDPTLKLTAPTIGSAGGGAGRGFPFTYAGSGVIADADPGVGIFRGNSATLASSTSLFVDDAAANGATGMSAWVASFDDYVGAVKGVLRAQSAADPTKFLEWPVMGITTASGYSKIALGTGWGPGGIGTAAHDTLISFDALGVSSNLNNQALTNAKSLTYAGEVGTTGATPAVNFTTGDLQLTTLTTNATPTFTAPPGVGWVQWCVIQDSTPRTITFPGSIDVTPPQPSTVAGSRTFYAFFYVGGVYHYAAPDLSVYALIDGTRAFTGGVTITQAAKTSGSPKALVVTAGAHTTLAASTEAPDIDLALNRTVQFATGALALQRAMVVRAPTYAFVAASTLAKAATLSITGAPAAGANATITNTFALVVESGLAQFLGGITLGLPPNSGAAAASVASVGSIRGARGANGFNISIRNETDLGDLTVLTTNTVTGPSVTLGDTAAGGLSPMLAAPSAGSITLRIGSSATQLQLTTTSVTSLMPFMGFFSTVTDGTLGYQSDATNGITGKKLFLIGQDCGGTTTTGGAVDLRPGSGTTAGGKLRLMSGGQLVVSVQRLALNDTGLGLYTATPVAQAVRPGQLTGTFGSTGTALVDVTAAHDQTILNNNFRVLRDMCNSMESKLSQAAGGLGAWA